MRAHLTGRLSFRCVCGSFAAGVQHMGSGDSRTQASLAFRCLDADGDGLLTKADLWKAVRAVQAPMDQIDALAARGARSRVESKSRLSSVRRALAMAHPEVVVADGALGAEGMSTRFAKPSKGAREPEDLGLGRLMAAAEHAAASEATHLVQDASNARRAVRDQRVEEIIEALWELALGPGSNVGEGLAMDVAAFSKVFASRSWAVLLAVVLLPTWPGAQWLETVDGDALPWGRRSFGGVDTLSRAILPSIAASHPCPNMLGSLVTMGHPQWNTMVAMMMGIRMALSHEHSLEELLKAEAACAATRLRRYETTDGDGEAAATGRRLARASTRSDEGDRFSATDPRRKTRSSEASSDDNDVQPLEDDPVGPPILPSHASFSDAVDLIGRGRISAPLCRSDFAQKVRVYVPMGWLADDEGWRDVSQSNGASSSSATFEALSRTSSGRDGVAGPGRPGRSWSPRDSGDAPLGFRRRSAHSSDSDKAGRTPRNPSTGRTGEDAGPMGSGRFKSYAPRVFRAVRRLCGVNDEAYALALGPDGVLRVLLAGRMASMTSLRTEGKSGSFFYSSADGRYLIKTISRAELLFLRRMLPAYVDHLTNEPNSLCPRLMSLHEIVLPNGTRVAFVVMISIFGTNLPIHERFDLKGSTVGRSSVGSADGARRPPLPPSTTAKDNDLGTRRFHVGAGKRNAILWQLKRDVDFLAGQGSMDYSLLVGVHMGTARDAKAVDQKWAARSAPWPVFMGLADSADGGIQARGLPAGLEEVYFMGIIDITASWGMRKRAERAVKGARRLHPAPRGKGRSSPPAWVPPGSRLACATQALSTIATAYRRCPPSSMPRG